LEKPLVIRQNFLSPRFVGSPTDENRNPQYFAATTKADLRWTRLTGLLRSLFRTYAAALEPRPGDGSRLQTQFRKGLAALVGEYGPEAR
jgi:hypothetical protein